MGTMETCHAPPLSELFLPISAQAEAKSFRAREVTDGTSSSSENKGEKDI